MGSLQPRRNAAQPTKPPLRVEGIRKQLCAPSEDVFSVDGLRPVGAERTDHEGSSPDANSAVGAWEPGKDPEDTRRVGASSNPCAQRPPKEGDSGEKQP